MCMCAMTYLHSLPSPFIPHRVLIARERERERERGEEEGRGIGIMNAVRAWGGAKRVVCA